MPDILANPLVQYYIAVLVMLWPMMKIFRRAGFSPVYAGWLAVPMLGYIVCAGILTFKKWPQKKECGVA